MKEGCPCEIFFTGGIQVPLEHGFVKGHDLAPLFCGDGFIEVVITRHLVHEREEVADKIRGPVVEEDVLILFGLEEGNMMDADLAKRAFVEGEKQAMEMPAQPSVETRDELCDLLLRDRRREVDVPDRQAGERLRIAREQAMQERRAASKVAHQEEGLFDWLGFVSGEENIVEPETEPMDERSDRPDEIEEADEDETLACEAGGRVFPLEE